MSDVVLIPCPAEHLAEFRLAMMRLSMGMGDWSMEAARPFVEGLDPEERTLVREASLRAIDMDRMPYRVAATMLGADTGHVLDLVTRINDWCVRAGLSPVLITDTLRDDTGDEVRAIPVIAILKPIAETFLSLLSDPGDVADRA